MTGRLLLTMERYLDIIKSSYKGYFNYLLDEVTQLHWENYFYGLILVSPDGMGFGDPFPWRKKPIHFFVRVLAGCLLHVLQFLPTEPYCFNRLVQQP